VKIKIRDKLKKEKLILKTRNIKKTSQGEIGDE
jgi:hypothetical protein